MINNNIDGLCFRNRHENIFDIYEKNEGLLVIYGAAAFGKMFLEEWGGLRLIIFATDKRI